MGISTPSNWLAPLNPLPGTSVISARVTASHDQRVPQVKAVESSLLRSSGRARRNPTIFGKSVELARPWLGENAAAFLDFLRYPTDAAGCLERKLVTSAWHGMRC